MRDIGFCGMVGALRRRDLSLERLTSRGAGGSLRRAKMESTARYLGTEADDAVQLSEHVEL
jgi:hypothetical protein